MSDCHTRRVTPAVAAAFTLIKFPQAVGPILQPSSLSPLHTGRPGINHCTLSLTSPDSAMPEDRVAGDCLKLLTLVPSSSPSRPSLFRPAQRSVNGAFRDLLHPVSLSLFLSLRTYDFFPPVNHFDGYQLKDAMSIALILSRLCF